MTKLWLEPLATLSIAIGIIGVLDFMPITPQYCYAAGTVVRDIYISQHKAADFNSIQKAIDSIPSGNNQWIRLHIVAGVYYEKVKVPSDRGYILLEGEGRERTVIEWGDHAGAGGDTDTANSATFASYAADFMARYITFKNSYYGVKYMAPAVAALVAGDRSSFHGCSLISVQDTLSDLAGSHYYENCYIEGSVDFIFGNAQSIFQGCEVSTGKASVPWGFITGQGRDSEKDDTGFVFKSCKVGGVTLAYLGRAWRAYARVIFYQTDMSDIIVSQGWGAWKFTGKEEHADDGGVRMHGPGSNRTGRVPWSKELRGYEIARFLDLSYISADDWLDAQPR